jgi:hypothetical protein
MTARMTSIVLTVVLVAVSLAIAYWLVWLAF